MSGSERTIDDETARKDYVAPVLKSYGDMRSLTSGTKFGTKGDGPDNPGGPKTRTVS